MGDIGQKFSDKNNKYKNIRSTILLKKLLMRLNIKIILEIILISTLLLKHRKFRNIKIKC